jgi:hypothetical protein
MRAVVRTNQILDLKEVDTSRAEVPSLINYVLSVMHKRCYTLWRVNNMLLVESCLLSTVAINHTVAPSC